MRIAAATKRKRIAAGVTALVMLAVMLLAAFCVAVEADHDCTGEDCSVCACIRQCENALRQLGENFAALAVVLLPVLFLLFAAGFFVRQTALQTPVSKKVRLNN